MECSGIPDEDIEVEAPDIDREVNLSIEQLELVADYLFKAVGLDAPPE